MDNIYDTLAKLDKVAKRIGKQIVNTESVYNRA